jgi:hypothetical protein
MIFDRGATQQQRQRSGNPEGCFLAGGWQGAMKEDSRRAL